MKPRSWWASASDRLLGSFVRAPVAKPRAAWAIVGVLTAWIGLIVYFSGLDVSMRERSAFGRELHDELGQHLVATALAAQVLAQKLNDAPAAADARAIVRWIEEAIAKTRNLARGLLLAQIEPDRLLQELEEL